MQRNSVKTDDDPSRIFIVVSRLHITDKSTEWWAEGPGFQCLFYLIFACDL